MTLRRILYCLILGTVGFSNSVVLGAQAPQVLEHKGAVQRDLAGKQSHAYQVTVDSGQFLRVVVEPQRIRVVVALFSPGDEKIAENLVGPFLPAIVCAIAQTSGDYRIEVSSPDAATMKGTYKINLEELRPAIFVDEASVAAQRLVIEARRTPSPAYQFAKFSEALEGWRRAGERRGEVDALWNLGDVSRSIDRLEKARDYYNEALVLGLEAGYFRAEAPLTNRLGQVSADSGDWQTALDSYERALAASRRIGDRVAERAALHSLAGTSQSLGDYQKALGYFEEQLSIIRVDGDRKAESSVIKDIGGMLYELGQEQKANDHFDRALLIAREAGDPDSESKLLLQIGVHFLVTKRLDKALDFFNRALSIFQAYDKRAAQAGVLNNIAATYQAFGERQKTLDTYDRVLALWRADGNRAGEAYALNNIGLAYYEFGEPQKALVFEEQAIELHRQVGNPAGVNRSLNDMARIYAALGDSQKAISLVEQVLTFSRSTADKRLEADTLYKLAKFERGRGNLVEASRNIQSAIQIAESTRATFTNPDLRSKFFVSAKDYYELYIDVLMQLHEKNPDGGFDSAALQASESARARSLLDLLAEARADIRRGVAPELIERERALQLNLNDKAQEQRRLLGGKHTAAQAETVEKEIRALLNEYLDLDAKIRATSPAYASLTRLSSFGLREIQQKVLDPDTVLLEYAMGSDRSYLWLVTSTSVASYVLPKRKDIEVVARRVSDLLTARHPVQSETEKQYRARVTAADSQYPKESAALSEMLFGQVSSKLGTKRLLIVADGALQYVPFAALSLPGTNRPLIVDHEIVSLPSASVLAALRRDTDARVSAAGVAVLADPVFGSDDPRVKATQVSQRTLNIELKRAVRGFDLLRDESISRLPYTRKEADAILASAPAGAGIKAVDFNASREFATSAELSKYRIVHFATHALLNGEHPELSGIVLSLVDREGRPRNGFLRLHDIYNLNLSADLVVLSACKTALGKEIRGEGLIGLSRGFMYAGTKRVVASLWKVDDWATAELMKRFYKKIFVERQRPAAALRAAQIEMWEQPKWRAPYYWAGFVIQGEPD